MSVIAACQASDDTAEMLGAPEWSVAGEHPRPDPRLADPELEPITSVVHDDATPGAASQLDVEALPRRARPRRTPAEIAVIHQNRLREELARSSVRLELPGNAQWTFEVAPGSRSGAYLVTSAEPLDGCGADGQVKVRVPYNSELDLMIDDGRTLLLLGHASTDAVDVTFATPWDGRSIRLGRESAAPVPLARAEVFGECPQG